MNIFEGIFRIIRDCEAVQKSNESDFKKEQAKLVAYDYIVEVLGDMAMEELKNDFC